MVVVVIGADIAFARNVDVDELPSALEGGPDEKEFGPLMTGHPRVTLPDAAVEVVVDDIELEGGITVPGLVPEAGIGTEGATGWKGGGCELWLAIEEEKADGVANGEELEDTES